MMMNQSEHPTSTIARQDAVEAMLVRVLVASILAYARERTPLVLDGEIVLKAERLPFDVLGLTLESGRKMEVRLTVDLNVGHPGLT